jgi:hypothetical protein
VLGGHEGRDHLQEALEFVALGERAKPRGAAGEDGGEIGQANGLALGDLAEGRFTKAFGSLARTAAQDLPTS